jgi:hypothetical protein
MIITGERVDRESFEVGTGWALKPEGACQGDICVPLPADAVTDSRVDVPVVAGRLGMAIVDDEATGLRAVGPASVAGRALTTAQAPELVLPDINGDEWRLSSLLGQKVVLVSWAPY